MLDFRVFLKFFLLTSLLLRITFPVFGWPIHAISSYQRCFSLFSVLLHFSFHNNTEISLRLGQYCAYPIYAIDFLVFSYNLLPPTIIIVSLYISCTIFYNTNLFLSLWTNFFSSFTFDHLERTLCFSPIVHDYRTTCISLDLSALLGCSVWLIMTFSL